MLAVDVHQFATFTAAVLPDPFGGMIGLHEAASEDEFGLEPEDFYSLSPLPEWAVLV